MTEKLHLTLRLDVSYDPNNVDKGFFERSLENLARHAIGETRSFAGLSPGKIDGWGTRVLERRNVEADAELSDHDRAEVERCRREVYEEEYKKIEAQLAAHPLKLKTKGENDFILDGANEFWVEIGNIVVYVRQTEDAVTVDLTPKVSAHETLDCCSAEFSMAEEFECTKCGKYNNDGDSYNDLCASCADKTEETQPRCGHPKSAIVSSDGAPNYCEMCEKGKP